MHCDSSPAIRGPFWALPRNKIGTFLRGVLRLHTTKQPLPIEAGTRDASMLFREAASWMSKVGTSAGLLVLAAAMWPYPHSALALPKEGAFVGNEIATTRFIEDAIVNVAGLHSTMVEEPQSGTKFPLFLAAESAGRPVQMLAGVGLRCRSLMKLKTINIFAFGLYVHPESLRAKLRSKYANVPPDVLKSRPDFYEDLLRHEVNLGVRLVVLYKGLTTQQIRSAFEVSLQNRLKKIEGAKDDGLQVFCSYLSQNMSIRKGTVIDIHWQQGGKLHTAVDGEEVGTIHSPHLCRAFFDLYIGDPPVSTSARDSIAVSATKIFAEN